MEVFEKVVSGSEICRRVWVCVSGGVRQEGRTDGIIPFYGHGCAVERPAEKTVGVFANSNSFGFGNAAWSDCIWDVRD